MGDLDHLTETVSDRGLRYFPPIPATYVGRKQGEVTVHESSSAECAALWLTVKDNAGVSQTVHVETVNALRLAEQIVRLCDQVDRDWVDG